MQSHTRQTKIAYAIAAIPAVLLPLSYLVVIIWAFATMVPSLFGGRQHANAGRNPFDVFLRIMYPDFSLTGHERAA